MAAGKRQLATYSLGLTSLVLTLATTTTGALVLFLVRADPSTVAALTAVVLVAGINLVAAWPAAQRGHDLLFQGRYYSRGMNAIRLHFLEEDPALGSVLTMPTDPEFPPFFRIGPGDGRSPWMGPAGQALAIAVVASALLPAALLALVLELVDISFWIPTVLLGLVAALGAMRVAHTSANRMAEGVASQFRAVRHENGLKAAPPVATVDD